jgi:hypothetical protein
MASFWITSMMSRTRSRLSVKHVALLGCAALAIGACSSEGESDLGAALPIFTGVFGSLFGGGAAAPSVSLKDAAAIPFPTMGVRVGGGMEFITVLSMNNGGDRLWQNKRSAAFLVRDGHIVQTAGLPRDIDKLASVGALPSLHAVAQGHPARYRWLADFHDLDVYNVQIDCEARPVRLEAVTILGKSIRTMRVDETCNAPSLEWSYTNKYWVDPDGGMTWMSIQYIHPQFDAISTEILRPPRA